MFFCKYIHKHITFASTIYCKLKVERHFSSLKLPKWIPKLQTNIKALIFFSQQSSCDKLYCYIYWNKMQRIFWETYLPSQSVQCNGIKEFDSGILYFQYITMNKRPAALWLCEMFSCQNHCCMKAMKIEQKLFSKKFCPNSLMIINFPKGLVLISGTSNEPNQYK